MQSKPASAFSPVAVTPDELGDAWRGGKLHLPLVTHLNGALFGRPNAGVDMTFDFPTLIAHVAKTRALAAGSIVGSGTVSNKEARRTRTSRSARAASATRASPSSAPSRRFSKASRTRRSCASAIACASRCSTAPDARFSARSTRPFASPAEFRTASRRRSRAFGGRARPIVQPPTGAARFVAQRSAFTPRIGRFVACVLSVSLRRRLRSHPDGIGTAAKKPRQAESGIHGRPHPTKQRKRKEPTMNRYPPSGLTRSSRFAAVAMSALTFILAVGVPSSLAPTLIPMRRRGRYVVARRSTYDPSRPHRGHRHARYRRRESSQQSARLERRNVPRWRSPRRCAETRRAGRQPSGPSPSWTPPFVACRDTARRAHGSFGRRFGRFVACPLRRGQAPPRMRYEIDGSVPQSLNPESAVAASKDQRR